MIPKKIHYCWVGGNPLPESAKKCIRSWKKYCPDYEIIEWNESNYDFSAIPYMKEAYDAGKWGFVPDYARLDIIYRYGGIYLDTDVEIVRSFDGLIKNRGFAGFESDAFVALGLGFGAEAGNPMIKTLMDSYMGKHFIKPDGAPDLISSPQLNTITLVEKYGLVPNGEFQEFNGFKIFPTEYFCPKSFVDGLIKKTENTYSIHHYDASWFSEDEKKELHERWAYVEAVEARRIHREKKLKRRKIFGGFLRKIFGNERWEKIKKLFIRG